MGGGRNRSFARRLNNKPDINLAFFCRKPDRTYGMGTVTFSDLEVVLENGIHDSPDTKGGL
jgi:hypothetical protein